MVRSGLRKVSKLGRGVVFITGLTVLLALMLIMATTALAGTGVGSSFNLGKKNVVNRLSQLVGAPDSAMLNVDNTSTGSSATALNLRVKPNHAPMKVNSSSRVNHLNADRLDSVDSSGLVQGRGKVYVGRVVVPTSNPSPNDTVLTVPGFAKVRTLNCQSTGANVTLGDFDQTRGTLSVWRDDGSADPSYSISPPLFAWNSNLQATERTTWHISVGAGPSAEAATIDVYTRATSNDCTYSATAQVWGA